MNSMRDFKRELLEDIEVVKTDWLLGFNINKCKVVSYGNVQIEYEYGMTDTQNNLHVFSAEESESDLGLGILSNKI